MCWYEKSKILVANNGVDTQKFNRINKLKKLLDKYNIDNKIFIFGMVARFIKVKNHLLLIKSLSLIKNKIRFKCILIGDKVSQSNLYLKELINKYNLTDEIIISEERNKIHEIFNLIDLNILTSYSECFPNVLIESMSCGTPCLSTNVGEAKKILGKSGWIISDFDELTLSRQLFAITNQGKNKIDKFKKTSRARIEENYSIEKMIEKYISLYSSYNIN